MLKFVIPLLQNKITKSEEVIVLTGMQPPPILLSPKEGLPHFCCMLEFQVCSKGEYLANEFATGGLKKGVIIDYTTGQVLSADEYYNAISGKISQISSYGSVPKRFLDSAWRAVKEMSKNDQIVAQFLKQQYLTTYHLYKTQDFYFSQRSYPSLYRPGQNFQQSSKAYTNRLSKSERENPEEAFCGAGSNYMFFAQGRHTSFEELPSGKNRRTNNQVVDDQENDDIALICNQLSRWSLRSLSNI